MNGVMILNALFLFYKGKKESGCCRNSIPYLIHRYDTFLAPDDTFDDNFQHAHFIPIVGVGNRGVY